MSSRDGLTGEHTDAELVARFVATRDEAAFRLLYRRHAPRLLRLLLRLTGGLRSDSEDLLQEAWLRAAEQLAELKKRDRFTHWIREITIHVHTDSLRREMRRTRIADIQPLYEETATFSPQSETDDRIRELDRCITSLPQGSRTVLVLHDVEGFKHNEIATMLGITAGTSKSQLFAARRTIREMMRERSEREGENVSSR